MKGGNNSERKYGARKFTMEGKKRLTFASRRPSQRFNFGLIMSNPFHLGTFAIAIIGWIIAFFASAVANSQANSNSSLSFPHYAWWAIVYQLFCIIFALVAVCTNSLEMYKVALTAFMTAAMAFSTSEVNVLIYVGLSSFEASAAGFLLLSIVNLLWMFYFGTIPSESSKPWSNEAYNMSPHQRAISHGSTAGLTTHKNANGTAASSPVVGGPMSSDFSNNRSSQISNSVSRSATPSVVPTEYPYQAKAIYGYEANSEDPNEISFKKGELLEVSDISGKWWQTRKADGSIGIAPSNYLSLISQS